LRSAGIVVAGVLLLFALAGTDRPDGWCHNARYFFDLIPLAALALALLVEREGVRWRPLAVEAAAGGLGAAMPLALSPTSAARQLASPRVRTNSVARFGSSPRASAPGISRPSYSFTAAMLRFAVATRNRRHFPQIPELKLIPF